MGDAFRLAVGQSLAALDGTQARLDWLEGILPEVTAAHSDMLLLPELFATGYNIGAQNAARAEPADGPTAQGAKTGCAFWVRVSWPRRTDRTWCAPLTRRV